MSFPTDVKNYFCSSDGDLIEGNVNWPRYVSGLGMFLDGGKKYCGDGGG
jgi:hypothetical protein